MQDYQVVKGLARHAENYKVTAYRAELSDPVEKNFCGLPSVMKEGPIFGMGYRSPWGFGNIIQAKVAKKYKLRVMLAQQSAREIKRTHRSFREVVECASISAREAGLDAPWGADGDHLKTESDLKEAAAAGCTHFTYDVSDELKRGSRAVTDKVNDFYFITKGLKGGGDFTCEISLDETEGTTALEDIVLIQENLKKNGVIIDEIAPRFPGYFEKGIDYYWKIEGGKKLKDTAEFEKYLKGLEVLSGKLGFRVSVHSGSDKFMLYPIIRRILKDNYHLKTAGTYYLEELKIIARHNTSLFSDILGFSLERFRKDRATYELSADMAGIPDIAGLSAQEMSRLLVSGYGSDDLRQVLHVTYGSVLSELKEDGSYRFADRMKDVLSENIGEYAVELENHILRHLF